LRKEIKIGTRASALALWQAEWVKSELEKKYPGMTVSLTKIKTTGDKILDVPLAKVGGKGLFVKEIEEALLAGRVDVGVHSLKDMPSELPDALTLGAFPLREDPCDVLLGRRDGGWDALPAGAVVGTSSPRRRAMVLAGRPDLRTEAIRGNVDTRLEKLRAGAYDALIMAAAGLKRLGLSPAHCTPLDLAEFVPAVGQGVLAVEARHTLQMASVIGETFLTQVLAVLTAGEENLSNQIATLEADRYVLPGDVRRQPQILRTNTLDFRW